MAEKIWKVAERKVAAWFGARRNPLSGSTDHTSKSDTIHGKLFIEVKQSKTAFAAVTLWDRTNGLAQNENKTPVVALTQKGRPGFWLVIHCDDLVPVALARGDALVETKIEVPVR